MSDMNVAVVIPARLGSTRFPGKVLAELRGKPWIQRVYETASAWNRAKDILVATGDQRVYDAVKGFGGRVVKTSSHHKTGSDRCSEVARDLDAKIVINLQADELLCDPAVLDEVIAPFHGDEALQMATLKREVHTMAEVLDPNVVKVVTDPRGRALYFSRAAIPYVRQKSPMPATSVPGKIYYKHMGVYAYRREFLLQYPALPASSLEELEGLEQMRALEAGVCIRVMETQRDSLRIDCPEDLIRITEQEQGIRERE